ncbi:MAG: 2-C-methyl-D-erythritol 2,4-cyclodiphosphate synthase [Xanthomonadales bacterium]|jgi:2-C-methyl-D-erythritol 2,4-cyclodiphosphate synthase|nr:2-C-methyl-D-erythritol 2,4-cyclodiphosphate synthase [Xanthomonadales bacterium]
MNAIRLGQGFDVHAFSEGDHVMLGGVRIPHDRGLAAHSDGDVLLHALCDALLGALALGDIGHHFPPDDPAWAGADSRGLLRAVHGLVAGQGYRVGNVDSTVICERPRLAPHLAAMRTAIAADLDIEVQCVSVKATTTERLGFCGRQEGIAAQAIVCLNRNS